MEKYYKCECGSETFVRVFNVWNQKVKVIITLEDEEEYWDFEELGKEKDHLYGYICEQCRKDAPDLSDVVYKREY